MVESELICTQILLAERNTKNWSREIFLIDSVLKTNPWAYKIKD